MRVVLASVLLAGVALLHAHAAGSGGHSVVFTPGEATIIGQPVEQQTDVPWPDDHSLWVVNPTRDCAWDVDDHWVYLASGTLTAGETIAQSGCMILDFTPVYKTVYGTTAWWSGGGGRFSVLVTSPTATLTVTACYAPQGQCFAIPPVLRNGAWSYAFCGRVLYAPDDPDLQPIAGSQGGRGVVSTVTATITASARTRNVGATVAATGPDISRAGCGQPLGPEQVSYPFHWATGA